VNGVVALEPTEFSKPKDGQRFIGVDVTIENVSSDDLNISSIIHFSLKDGTGQQYNGVLLAQGLAGATPEGRLVVGDRVRGTVAYSVPTDAAGLQWIFEWMTGGRAAFNIVAP